MAGDDSDQGPIADGVSPGESALADRLIESMSDELTLALGSGVGGPAIPSVADVINLADEYALGRGDGGDFSRALAEAKTRLSGKSQTEVYAEYRRLFGAWVAGGEFDLIAQEAVLSSYRPAASVSSNGVVQGIWQRVSQSLGEQIERDTTGWLVTPGLEALAALLVAHPGTFGHRVLTTNFDPMLEISIRRAGGKAISLPLGAEGSVDETFVDDRPAIRVYHVHGFWRPILPEVTEPLLHDPLHAARDRVKATTTNLIHGDTVCVIGTSDRALTMIDAIVGVRQRHPQVQVLWALHHDGPTDTTRLREVLAENGLDDVEIFTEIDAERLFSLVARRLGVEIARRDARPLHRTTHTVWEQQLVSWPTAAPPEDLDLLIKQLQRRFGWGVRATEAAAAQVLFWPVRLQSRATVIHMVQAVVAGALAARGMRVVVSIDDFNARQSDPQRQTFQADLARWVRYVAADADLTFTNVTEFIDGATSSTADDLVRGIDPWTVAQDLYGTLNPPLHRLLVAIKAVPNMGRREIMERPQVIVQALLRNNAQRLLTPLTMWPVLHQLLRGTPTGSVITLGGWDEQPFWELWRHVYGLGISQLYNPYCHSLSHRSGLVAWTSRTELFENLDYTVAVDGWDQPGRYVPWLFQNALLLPIYLTRRSAPKAGGTTLRAWAAFQAALHDGAPALDVLADHVSQLYLGHSG